MCVYECRKFSFFVCCFEWNSTFHKMQQFWTTLSRAHIHISITNCKVASGPIVSKKIRRWKMSFTCNWTSNFRSQTHAHTHIQNSFFISRGTLSCLAQCSWLQKVAQKIVHILQTSYLLIWVFNLNFVWTNVKNMEKILMKNVLLISKTCMF